DDLQWVDTASLNLVRLLITAPDNRYLLVIGAYRDNEVQEAHPLMLTVAESQKAGSTVHRIVLQPLALSNINRLITDTLTCAPDNARLLAELVFAKTNGNPFFVNEFLKSLYAEDLLRFNFNGGDWQWDVSKIQARNITDNVVELLSTKL